ncbi:MAG: amidohydrolase family protein [Candidatus Latescibacterota bacterium]|jgi:predicted TIM-barrel fold metal-dependent hydrolase
MNTYGVDKVVLCHPCYYGRDNSYTSHCIATYPDRFAGIGLLVGHRLYAPDDEGFAPLLDLHHRPNVYIRTSLHNPSKEKPPFYDMWPYLERPYNTFGPQRLIYGNLYELLIMKDLIPFFMAEDKEWILGGTAEKVYFKNRS